MAHRGQSRALLLRCRGRVQSYTPSAYSSQNTTLSHAASTGRKQTVIFQLANRNLRDIFYTLKDMFFVNFYSGFTKFGTLPIFSELFSERSLIIRCRHAADSFKFGCAYYIHAERKHICHLVVPVIHPLIAV